MTDTEFEAWLNDPEVLDKLAPFRMMPGASRLFEVLDMYQFVSLLDEIEEDPDVEVRGN